MKIDIRKIVLKLSIVESNYKKIFCCRFWGVNISDWNNNVFLCFQRKKKWKTRQINSFGDS